MRGEGFILFLKSTFAPPSTVFPQRSYLLRKPSAHAIKLTTLAATNALDNAGRRSAARAALVEQVKLRRQLPKFKVSGKVSVLLLVLATPSLLRPA